MSESKEIEVSRYVYFDKEYGSFFLTSDAQEIIYRKKNIICSYSGSNEWIGDFMFEMIDLFTGASPYNYAINSTDHKKVIPEIWAQNKESVIKWVEKSKSEEWGKAMYKTVDTIIDNLPTY